MRSGCTQSFRSEIGLADKGPLRRPPEGEACRWGGGTVGPTGCAWQEPAKLSGTEKEGTVFKLRGTSAPQAAFLRTAFFSSAFEDFKARSVLLWILRNLRAAQLNHNAFLLPIPSHLYLLNNYCSSTKSECYLSKMEGLHVRIACQPAELAFPRGDDITAAARTLLEDFDC